jgi:hypothetical protein
MSEHARVTNGLRVAIVVLLLLAYPLSFGPACWLNSRTGRGGPTMAVVYRPIGQLLEADNLASKLISWYGCLGAQFREAGLGWSAEEGPVWWVPYACPFIEESALGLAELPDDSATVEESLQSHPVPEYTAPLPSGIPVEE